MKVGFKGVYMSRTCYPGLHVIKLFSSSAQLSMKFQLLINVEISGKFNFSTQQLVIYPAHQLVIYPTHKCWHFDINGQDKF